MRRLEMGGKLYVKNTIYDGGLGRAEFHLMILTEMGDEEWVRISEDMANMEGRRVRIVVEVADEEQNGHRRADSRLGS